MSGTYSSSDSCVYNIDFLWFMWYTDTGNKHQNIKQNNGWWRIASVCWSYGPMASFITLLLWFVAQSSLRRSMVASGQQSSHSQLATLAIKVHFVCFFGFVVPELVLLSSNSNTLFCWGMFSSNRSRIIITFLVASELLMLAYFPTSAINLKICTLSSTVPKAKSEVEPPNQQILASHWFDSPCMCGS